ncbi:hypothetical protein BDN72DRAFT_111788 [Pluteus cervinus]|uniref:Uncharacterized protein n=1 Tax=Pluteus cervinus TaxID=181527 RepID=A0ACD3AMQ4_9AGAR|nr:hypothetical protein BDN72DRAFT_111788 [Pluteus cervinus]
MFKRLCLLMVAFACVEANFTLKTIPDPLRTVDIVESEIGVYPGGVNKDGATTYVHEYLVGTAIGRATPQTRRDTFVEDATHYAQSDAVSTTGVLETPQYVITECSWDSEEAEVGECKVEVKYFVQGTSGPPLPITSMLSVWSGTILPWSTVVPSGTSSVQPTKDPFAHNSARRVRVDVVKVWAGALLSCSLGYLSF